MDGEDHVGRHRLVHKHKFVVTIITIINIINPQRMQLYSYSIVLCVCLLSRQLLHTWFIRCKQGAIRLFTTILKYECVDFIENASFKSSLLIVL